MLKSSAPFRLASSSDGEANDTKCPGMRTSGHRAAAPLGSGWESKEAHCRVTWSGVSSGAGVESKGKHMSDDTSLSMTKSSGADTESLNILSSRLAQEECHTGAAGESKWMALTTEESKKSLASRLALEEVAKGDAHHGAIKESDSVHGTDEESPWKNAGSSSSRRESTEADACSLTSGIDVQRRTTKGGSSGGGEDGGVSLGDEMALLPALSVDGSAEEAHGNVQCIQEKRTLWRRTGGGGWRLIAAW